MVAALVRTSSNHDNDGFRAKAPTRSSRFHLQLVLKCAIRRDNVLDTQRCWWKHFHIHNGFVFMVTFIVKVSTQKWA